MRNSYQADSRHPDLSRLGLHKVFGSISDKVFKKPIKRSVLEN